MENKYYTPTIEEFHVGFLFEIYVDRFDEWKLTSIHNMYDYQSVFNLGLKKDSGGNRVDDKWIRVKYLDKSDIESFGFEYITNDNPETVIFSEQDSNYEFDRYSLHKKYYSINLYLKREGHEYNLLYGYNDNELIGFTIKNKSELKKLLQQLNIC